jgi:hypothetical protein
VEARRLEARQLAWDERRQTFLATQQAHHEGEDLRAELTRSESAIGRLRAAVSGLVATRTALEAKLKAAGEAGAGEGQGEAQGAAGGDPALVAEITRARDEVAMKVDLGQRVLEAAEAAAFRLLCHAPLRILLRRRPRDATGALSHIPVTEAAIHAAAGAVEGFLVDVQRARAALDGFEVRRPAHVPAGDEGPLAHARRELSAMEAAYGALRERLSIARLRLSARAGAEVVEAAAGAVTGAAAAAALDPAEIGGLVTEVARAEAAVADAAPEMGGAGGLAEALAAGAAALDRSDAASLWDLITALREVR